MSTSSITRKFVYNNEVVENLMDIPPTAFFSCIVSAEDGSVLFIEDHRDGRLNAIESFDTLFDSRAKAVETARLAEELDTLFEEVSGTKIYIHQNPEDFKLGFDLQDGEMYSVKEGFIYDPAVDERIRQESDDPFPYIAEIIEGDPPIVFRRGLFDRKKQLMILEYLLYGGSSENQVREMIVFAELTPAGEQWVLLSRANNSAGFDSLPPYVFPANQDASYEAVEHFLTMDKCVILDENGEAIANPEGHPVMQQVFYTEDSVLTSSRILIDAQLAECEVFDVPIEFHCFVAHAMLRKLHSEKLVVSNSPHCSHYVRINSPLIEESSDNIMLEPGQVRQHVTIYHMCGNYILHECEIHEKDGGLVKTLMLNSPLDQTVYKTFDADDEYT